LKSHPTIVELNYKELVKNFRECGADIFVATLKAGYFVEQIIKRIRKIDGPLGHDAAMVESEHHFLLEMEVLCKIIPIILKVRTFFGPSVPAGFGAAPLLQRRHLVAHWNRRNGRPLTNVAQSGSRRSWVPRWPHKGNRRMPEKEGSTPHRLNKANQTWLKAGR